MLRIAAILISVLLILPRYGMAQHAPDWLDANADEEWPDSTVVDSTIIEQQGNHVAGHDSYGHGPEQIFNQPVELPIVRFKKQAIQKVTVAGGWLVATEGNDLSNSYLETSISVGIPVGLLRSKLLGTNEQTFAAEPPTSNTGTP